MTHSADLPMFDNEAIWCRLDPEGPFKGDWLEFRHRQQTEFLHGLAQYTTVPLELSHVGNSEEGRTLHTLRFGTGKRKVLIWARQHGDEPDCTAGLSMALSELLLSAERPVYRTILDQLDIAVLPMVNPDGVARFTRRNAQGIDINRDALAQATHEGQALMKIRESFDPEYCFNLHDMYPRKSTEDGKLVAIAFQAGPFEPRDIDNEVRLKAKTVIAKMHGSMLDYAEGHVAKYTADYMHRAFGDSMMRLGVSSILIEAGGWPEAQGGDAFVRRLFALSLLRGLYAVATSEDAVTDRDTYESIPYDSGRRFVDLKLSGGEVLSGSGRSPFMADLGINRDRVAGFPHEPLFDLGTLENIGDLEDELANRTISLKGHIVLPGLMAISPAHQFNDRRFPNEEDAKPLLAAGITTLVTGFGPFESQRARETWLEQAKRNAPPLNIIAFERVPHITDIRRRHGLTDFAGLLVQDLMISGEDLLNFCHLYHPAMHSAIEGEYAGKMVGVDLFFQMGSSSNDTHLHLGLTHVAGQSGYSPVRSEDLRDLVDEFLRDPSQISLSRDAEGEAFDWLPMMISYGGLNAGRVPTPNMFGRILMAYGAEETSGLIGTMNMTMLSNARAFRLNHLGRIEIGNRADLTVFHRDSLEGRGTGGTACPAMTILNGAVVFDRSLGTSEASEGVWYFASTPSRR